MIKKIGELFFFIFALIMGILDIQTSGKDYSLYSYAERVAFFEENKDTYNALVDYAFVNTDESRSITSINIYDPQKSNKFKTDVLRKVVDDRVSVYRKDDDRWVRFPFQTGCKDTEFSDCGIYYSENRRYIVPASGTVAEYDEERGKYVAFLASSYVEIDELGDGWFFYQVAYSRDGAFRLKN